VLDEVRALDAQLKASHRRITEAVRASKTTLTEIFGVGPIIACMAIGHSRDVRRFHSRDHYAAYNGTAPVEFSSAWRVVHRLSRRGNRQLNHAIHMAAVCQIRQPHSEGRAYSTARSPTARPRRRYALSNAGSSTPSIDSSSSTPNITAREDTQGTTPRQRDRLTP
jgi:transposase